MLLKRLLDTPQDFLAHSRWYALFSTHICTMLMPTRMPGALILEIAYGLDIQSERDPYILDAETALRSLAKIGNIGSYMGMSPLTIDRAHAHKLPRSGHHTNLCVYIIKAAAVSTHINASEALAPVVPRSALPAPGH